VIKPPGVHCIAVYRVSFVPFRSPVPFLSLHLWLWCAAGWRARDDCPSAYGTAERPLPADLEHPGIATTASETTLPPQSRETALRRLPLTRPLDPVVALPPPSSLLPAPPSLLPPPSVPPYLPSPSLRTCQDPETSSSPTGS
ncbi:hypothetical protein Vafri_2426, partial [Volvox africanus]